MDTIILIDGNLMLCKYYYGFGDHLTALVEGKTVRTSQLYGFVTLIQGICREYPGAHIVVAFDDKRIIKKEVYPTYKAQREPKPEIYAIYDDIANMLVGIDNVRVITAEGYEADDIIYTMCNELSSRQYKKVIHSKDKDLYINLQHPNTYYVMDMSKKKFKEYGRELCTDTFKVEPDKLLLLRSLLGDSSDNIPRVIPRFPTKTAIELAKRYVKPCDIYGDKDYINSWHEKLATTTVYEQWSTNYKIIEPCNIPLDTLMEDIQEFKGVEYFLNKYKLLSLAKII